jgi:hypothetical protein
MFSFCNLITTNIIMARLCESLVWNWLCLVIVQSSLLTNAPIQHSTSSTQQPILLSKQTVYTGYDWNIFASKKWPLFYMSLHHCRVFTILLTHSNRATWVFLLLWLPVRILPPQGTCKTTAISSFQRYHNWCMNRPGRGSRGAIQCKIDSLFQNWFTWPYSCQHDSPSTKFSTSRM